MSSSLEFWSIGKLRLNYWALILKYYFVCVKTTLQKKLILFGNISCFALTRECERSFLIGLAKRLVLMRKSPGTAKFMNTLSIVKHVIKFLRGNMVFVNLVARRIC